MSRPPSLDQVRRILERVEGSDATEVELARGGFKLRIRRRSGARPRPLGRWDLGDRPTAPEIAVVAPLTGVFYRAASPNVPPSIREGDLVQPDTAVGLIETMKTANEVVAERRGRARELIAESGQLGHAGDRLLRLEAEEGAEPPNDRVPR